MSVAKANREIKQAREAGEGKRLRHRRALQIEQIGVECEDEHCNPARDGAVKGAARRQEEKHARNDERQGSGDRSGEPSAPKDATDYEGKHEEMWKRQPDRSELFVAGSAGVNDAAGDIQVGFRVAVVERPTLPRAPSDRECAEDNEQQGRIPRRSVASPFFSGSRLPFRTP